MKVLCYLTFNRRGVLKVSKGSPTLRNGEFAVRLRVEVPDSVFAPEFPDVSVAIPERSLIVPSVEVIDGGASSISGAEQ